MITTPKSKITFVGRKGHRSPSSAPRRGGRRADRAGHRRQAGRVEAVAARQRRHAAVESVETYATRLHDDQSTLRRALKPW